MIATRRAEQGRAQRVFERLGGIGDLHEIDQIVNLISTRQVSHAKEIYENLLNKLEDIKEGREERTKRFITEVEGPIIKTIGRLISQAGRPENIRAAEEAIDEFVLQGRPKLELELRNGLKHLIVQGLAEEAKEVLDRILPDLYIQEELREVVTELAGSKQSVTHTVQSLREVRAIFNIEWQKFVDWTIEGLAGPIEEERWEYVSKLLAGLNFSGSDTEKIKPRVITAIPVLVGNADQNPENLEIAFHLRDAVHADNEQMGPSVRRAIGNLLLRDPVGNSVFAAHAIVGFGIDEHFDELLPRARRS